MRTRYWGALLAAALVLSGTNTTFAQYQGMPAMGGGNMPGSQPGLGMMTAPYPTGYLAPASYLSGAEAPGGCNGDCGGTCDECSPAGGYEHCWHVYGEFLYLRPRDSEVAWAAPIDGPIVGPPAANPIQIRPLGVLDMEYQPSWRIGFQYNTSECSAFNIQYTMFESSTNDRINIAAPDVIRSLVSHPGTLSATRDFLSGTASHDINYDQVDFDLRTLLWYDTDYQVGYLLGANLVQMEQRLQADFAGAGTERVATDIDFYGAGGRFGLFGESQFNTRWRFYGKGTGNLVAGEFRADYDQNQSFAPQVVDTAWHAGRIVGIWDLEAGLKWNSRCGNYSANFGYVFSAWTNVVQTDEWIHGVRTNNFIDMDSTMTFDGLVARFEARY